MSVDRVRIALKNLKLVVSPEKRFERLLQEEEGLSSNRTDLHQQEILLARQQVVSLFCFYVVLAIGLLGGVALGMVLAQ